MKTRLLIIVGLILTGFVVVLSGNPAYGIWMPETPQRLLEQSQTVFVGTITSVNVLEFERSNTYNAEENGVPRIFIENYTQSLDQYTVNIEEFLKNPQESHTITMLEATVSGPPGSSVSIGGFELGDRVLFYVPKIDGTNQYSPESFKIPKFCDARDVVAQKRLQMGEDFTVTQDGIKVDYGNFTANKPIEFVYSKDMGTLDGKSFDVVVGIFKTGNNFESVLNQEIHAESKPCEWIASAVWGFTPEQGNYNMNLLTKQDNNTSYDYSGFSVRSDIPNYLLSPLKQFKTGIQSNKITCKEGLEIVIKSSDKSPACVKPETKTKLIERGWILRLDSSQAVRLGAIPQVPLRIEGFNETQYVGKKIEFTIKFNGTGYDCGYPTITIENNKQQKVWESNHIVTLCDPDTKIEHIEKEWHLEEDHLGVPILNATGFYILRVEFDHTILQNRFLVK